MDEIKKQARERGFNSFHFSFSGGEPTLHKGFLALLDHYGKDTTNCNYQSVHMTSNISLGLKWFKKFVKATEKLHRTSVTASFHKEHADKTKFTEKLIFLQESDVQVTVNMVMVPEKFETLWEDALYFHTQGINVTLKPQSDKKAQKVVHAYKPWMLEKLRHGLPQMDYTLARINQRGRSSTRPKTPFPHLKKNKFGPTLQVELTDKKGKKWFIDQAERFNAFNFNRFQGWDCSSGFRSIIIREPDGLIKRSYSCSDKPLGHIEKGFKLFNGPVACSTQTCVSSADSKIPKRKPDCTIPLWSNT